MSSSVSNNPLPLFGTRSPDSPIPSKKSVAPLTCCPWATIAQTHRYGVCCKKPLKLRAKKLGKEAGAAGKFEPEERGATKSYSPDIADYSRMLCEGRMFAMDDELQSIEDE